MRSDSPELESAILTASDEEVLSLVKHLVSRKVESIQIVTQLVASLQNAVRLYEAGELFPAEVARSGEVVYHALDILDPPPRPKKIPPIYIVETIRSSHIELFVPPSKELSRLLNWYGCATRVFEPMFRLEASDLKLITEKPGLICVNQSRIALPIDIDFCWRDIERSLSQSGTSYEVFSLFGKSQFTCRSKLEEIVQAARCVPVGGKGKKPPVARSSSASPGT